MSADWEQLLGPLDSVAAYRRRQAYRGGLTMVAVRRGDPKAVIKLRDEPEGLQREQHALEVVADVGSSSFRAPCPLGSGTVDGWWWSAQEAVFRKPHRPVFEAPPELFDEVTAALAPLSTGTSSLPLSHGDLTPWNLRRDSANRTWLFDWEDAGHRPAEADRTYFAVTAHVLGGASLPNDLPHDAIDYWRGVVEYRQARKAPGVTLPDRLLDALHGARE